MKSQCSVSLQADRGLYLHYFITLVSTRGKEGKQRGDKIYYTQYFPSKSSPRPGLNEEHYSTKKKKKMEKCKGKYYGARMQSKAEKKNLTIHNLVKF